MIIRYALSFTAGYVTGKVVKKENLDSFKKAALKSYVIVKDEIKGAEKDNKE